MRLMLLALSLMLAVISGCKDEPPYARKTVVAGGKAQLCQDGGATYHQESDACVCSDGQNWTGARCEKPANAHMPESVPPANALTADGAHQSATIQVKPEDAKPAADDDDDDVDEPVKHASTGNADLVNRCHQAKGEWVEEDHFCLCLAGRVLVANTCRHLPGRPTDDACLRSVFPGHWQKGVCECDEGLVFAPSRGGCVKPYKGGVAALRRECEDSMSRGKWDAADVRCLCPRGKVWLGESCQTQYALSSKDVCESDFNHGTWDYGHKLCVCPGGRVWVNQACIRATSVDPAELCEREAGGGKWNSRVMRCICPRLGHWDEETFTCKE